MLDMPLVTMGEKLGKITLSVSASVYCLYYYLRDFSYLGSLFFLVQKYPYTPMFMQR